MTYSLTWLPEVLMKAGLRVGTEPGWEKRGRAEMGTVHGVICHQTEDTRPGNMPSLATLRDGRKGLPGPLAQLGLARDGTFYVIAAGKCNHAGEGHWKGIVNGNSNFIGIEAENRGTRGDPWPAVQMAAYKQGVAAILKHVERGVDFCVGHKEWARDRTDPDTQKHDPSFDMDAFRADVGKLLNANLPALQPIPKVEPDGQPGGGPPRPTLQRGMDSPLCEQVQELLGVFPANPHFGPRTEAAVREFQRARGMVADGIVGPRTWLALDVFREDLGHEDADDPTVVQPFVASATDRLAWGALVTPEFKAAVRQIAADIGCDANDLMACMAFESGIDPARVNSTSGATGLIQFMPKTAKALGTSTAELAKMTAEEQLRYVAAYFKWHPHVRTLEDTYMAILWPAAVGKPNDHVLFRDPSRQYSQNSGLDSDRDGRVTKAEAAAKVRARLVEGLKANNLG
jgi:peptidoglycan hydrolase-like protein with peptidoglycan-binding domain